MRRQGEQGGLRVLRRMLWEQAKGQVGLCVEIWRLRARDALAGGKAPGGTQRGIGDVSDAASVKAEIATHGDEWRTQVLEVATRRLLSTSCKLSCVVCVGCEESGLRSPVEGADTLAINSLPGTVPGLSNPLASSTSTFPSPLHPVFDVAVCLSVFLSVCLSVCRL